MKNNESLADLEVQSNCLYCNNLDLRLIEEELQVDEGLSANPQALSSAGVKMSDSDEDVQ